MNLQALSQAMPRNGACDESTDRQTYLLTENALSRDSKYLSFVTRTRAYRIFRPEGKRGRASPGRARANGTAPRTAADRTVAEAIAAAMPREGDLK